MLSVYNQTISPSNQMGTPICHLRMQLAALVKLFTMQDRPEYSWKIACWTLNINQSITMQEDVNTLSYGHINSRLQHTVDDNKHRLSYGHRNRTQTIQQMTTHTYRYIMSVWTITSTFTGWDTFMSTPEVACITCTSLRVR